MKIMESDGMNRSISKDDHSTQSANRSVHSNKSKQPPHSDGHSDRSSPKGPELDSPEAASLRKKYTRPPTHYQPTCHVNGGGVASVLMSCCAPELDFLGGANSPVTTPTGADNPYKKSNPRSNFWSEKAKQAKQEERGDVNYPEDGRQQSSPGMEFSLPTVERPGGNEHAFASVSSQTDPAQRSSYTTPSSPAHTGTSPDFPAVGLMQCGVPSKRGKNPRQKPFASTTLLDRGDSLLQQQSSLLSLIASESEIPTNGTFDSPTASFNVGPVGSFNGTTMTRSPRNKDEDSELYSNVSRGVDENNRFEGDMNGLECNTQHKEKKKLSGHGESSSNKNGRLTPSPRSSKVESPAMELSMAKQEALRSLSSGLARSRSGSSVASYGIGRASPTKDLKSMFCRGAASPTPSSKSLPTHTEEDGESVSVDASTQHNSPSSRSSSALKTMSIHGSSNLGNIAPPYATHDPPVWGADCINPDLKYTYHYRRLFMNPHTICSLPKDEQKSKWWYQLGLRMDSTLSHVHDSNWKALYEKNLDYSTLVDDCCSQSVASANTTTLVEGGTLVMVGDNDAQEVEAGVSSAYTCDRNGINPFTALAESLNAAPPSNVWSEPSASSLKVRGSTYNKDGIKIESKSSMFSLLGIDNLVKGPNSVESCNADAVPSQGGVNINVSSPEEVGCANRHRCCTGTNSFFDRWQTECRGVGLNSPPFLLVINFIVPWGNFQSYFFRPNADNGPFSSRHVDHPEERAWKAFLEGDCNYRNKRLKFIPRIHSGPWVVKKMVGSTPVLIGTKLPVTYYGSINENYLEICLDVTQGPSFANTIANTVVGKAESITLDLGFVIEGKDEDGTLPERLLTLFRLHHLDMKKAWTHNSWREEVMRRQRERNFR